MKQWVFGFMFLFGASFSSGSRAQGIFQDPHPYQSQSFFRLGPSAEFPGLIGVVLPASIPEYRYWSAGDPEAHVEQNAMLLFDKRNPLPESEFAGSNYLFTRGGYLATVSADGFLVYKGQVSLTPEVAGGVWFVNAGTHELFTVDSFGYYAGTGFNVRGVRVVGGNYFVDSAGVLTTIKSVGAGAGSGVGIATRKEGWNFSNIIRAGGNYFLRADGTLVTVSSSTGFFNDGVIPESKPAITGGNYYIGQDHFLYTIDKEGTVFKNTDFVLKGEPLVIGYSFLKLEDGLIVAVDASGVPHRTLVRISTTGVRTRVVNTIDVDIDVKSIFVPRILN